MLKRTRLLPDITSVALAATLAVGSLAAQACTFFRSGYFKTATEVDVELCLQAGAEINSKLMNGGTPLHYGTCQRL